MHIPPKVAAMGMYLFKISVEFCSLFLFTLMEHLLSLKFLAKSETPDPETSILVFENKAQEIKMKVIQKIVWNGSLANSNKFLIGEI
jgi:hypothetical protein